MRCNLRYLIYTIAFCFLFLGVTILALNPDWFNRPIARAINSFTQDRQLTNLFAFGITYPTLQGVVLVSLIWCCWFSSIKMESRTAIVAGTCASVVAGILARFLQRTIPTTPKPIFDPILAIHVPAVFGDIESLRATSFPDSHTFPSERATMFAGIAITLFLVQRKLGLVALGCTMVIESSRIYLGLHYPTDIIGSFCLAAMIVLLAQMQWSFGLAKWSLAWERASPSTFYASAFLASYQITTAFQDIRDLMGLDRLGRPT